jgi:hypothetical protein
VQDDPTQPHHTPRPETDREFETPQSVREIHPSDETFQRRWEKVQATFVVSGTRGRAADQ